MKSLAVLLGFTGLLLVSCAKDEDTAPQAAASKQSSGVISSNAEGSSGSSGYSGGCGAGCGTGTSSPKHNP